MIRKIIAFVCVFTVLGVTPAFSYQRERHVNQKEQEETQPASTHEEEPIREKGRGLTYTAYALIGLGGAAAIAGATIASVSSSKRTMGVIIGSSGAALSLAGTMMLLFAAHERYGVAPQIDPSTGSYGLAFAANF